MDVHDVYMVHPIYSFSAQTPLHGEINISMYIHFVLLMIMVRRMKAVIMQIESVVTPSGNSGHVVVPKAWIGKEAIVTLKEKQSRIKSKK